MSATNVGSTVGKPEKRKTILTEKAMMNKIEWIQKERKRKVDEIKHLILSLKELMRDEKNVSPVKSKLNVLLQLSDDATALHESLMLLIPTDEQERQKQWFLKVNKHKEGCIQDVEAWFKIISTPQKEPLLETHIAGRPQLEASSKENNTQDVENEKCPQSHQVPQNHDQDEIAPCDSISNQGGAKYSTKSNVSTTSSARLRAEAEVAALLARQRLLKEKHALEEQEEQIRKRKEQLQLEAEIAASVAKVNVLRMSGSNVMSAASQKLDGMESYFEKGLNIHAEPFLPHRDVKDGGRPTESETLNPNFGGAKSKQLVGVKSVQQGSSVPAKLQSTAQNDVAPPMSHVKDGNVHFFRNIGSENYMMSVMEKQNEITSMLVHQQCLASLPRREIQIFDGNPLQYHAFMQSFEQTVEQKADNDMDCLHYLEQYTRGQPQQLVRSCQHMTDGNGYAAAKTLLHEHFGNDHVIASAYMDKIFSWPSIKSEDAKALQAYSLFLRGCCNAMKDVYNLCDLNTSANMLNMIKRLPYKLRDKWRTTACDIQERCGRRAMFSDIVTFIERQVKIAMDPVFGDIQDAPTLSVLKGSGRTNTIPRSKVGGSSFATSVTSFKRKTRPDNKRDGAETSCLYCKNYGHRMESCTLLEKKAHSEKMHFLKVNGVCFGCLCTGHISRECRKRLSCEICGSRHPSLLHIHQRENKVEMEKNSISENPADSGLVEVQSSGLTGAGDQDCKLAIVPVRVKSSKGRRAVETYAFLDPGSTASFCTVGLMDKLGLPGRKTRILLRTMGQEQIVDSCVTSHLEVAGLDSDVYCEISKLFVQQKMPVDRSNIPHQHDLDKWPHLKHVPLPEIDANVEILIGTNVPSALEPLEVIRSVDGGPYAVKTILGWTVNGPLGGCDDSPGCQSTVSINRISAVTLDELWNKQFKMDFPENKQDELVGMSKDDCKFLEIADRSVKLVDGHYSIALPLKDRNLSLPDNRLIAEQRILNLKRRFAREPSFHKDYIEFMHRLACQRQENGEFVVPDVLSRVELLIDAAVEFCGEIMQHILDDVFFFFCDFRRVLV